MNMKKIVTVVLLLFVIVSVAFLLAKEFTPKQTAINSSGNESFIKQGTAVDSSSRDTTRETAVIDRNPNTTKITQKKNPQVEARKIVVYYFHRTVRCPTCIKLEKYSDEAILNGFPAQLKNGQLEWRVINIEDEDNEHFENDFKLYSQSLVIVEISNGKQKSWKNLEKIWELVGNKEAFIYYVQEELKSYLQEKS
jgi:hypothetical protein